MTGKLYLSIGLVAAAIAAWFFLFKDKEQSEDVEYRYAAVQKGELLRSISATGQLVPLTTVDVKSKAGGKVVKLYVEEGTIVKQGDRIAEIDPADTKASYEQANADLQSAQARAAQARSNYSLQVATSSTGIRDAQANLQSVRSRLAQAQIEASRQPTLTSSTIAQAQAAYDGAVQALNRLNQVTIPQERRDVQLNLSSAKTSLDTAQTDYDRQQTLLRQGYVSQSVVDRAASTLASAKSNYESAQQKAQTLEIDIRASQRTAELDLDKASAGLQQAKANSSDNAISQKQLEQARAAVRQAEISLQKAKDDQINNSVRRSDITSAQASTVRSRVAAENAKVQLDSTSVLAPRDGVVTLKYLEEGTIIPPGTSTFAQGTSLVQISDVTQMFVECAVDEADIGSVKVGQKVRTITEAYPGTNLDGVVTRVNPAAKTDQNITAIKVRVRISDLTKARLLPGMNATCEFITMSKPNVLIAPSQAIQRENGKTFVKVKTKDPLKPEKREVQLGESGNEGVEITSGLKEGEEVVIAEIDLKQLRDTQQKMAEAAQGGGLAGGMGNNRRPGAGSGTRTGGGGGPRGGGR